MRILFVVLALMVALPASSVSQETAAPTVEQLQKEIAALKEKLSRPVRTPADTQKFFQDAFTRGKDASEQVAQSCKRAGGRIVIAVATNLTAASVTCERVVWQ